jgi:hypothetical protein
MQLSQKKSSTPRASAAKKPTRAELRRQLARDLAAALANPEIPAKLYNEITDAILDFQSRCIDYNDLLYSEETIGKALEMFAEKGGAR